MDTNRNDRNLKAPDSRAEEDSHQTKKHISPQGDDIQREAKQNPVQAVNSSQTENPGLDLNKERELRKPPKSHKKFWIIAAGIALVVAVAGASIASCSKGRHMAIEPQKEPIFRYRMLEASWNQYAEKYPAKFRLSGERGGSDLNVLKALDKWLSAFSVARESDYQKELERLKNLYGVTVFHAWEDFRREHHRQNELALNAQMAQTALCEGINNYIGIARAQNPQDYISAETVKTIVYMNSICAFFDGEKEKLHKEGIDTEIYECKKLDPGDKFPLLQRSLNN